MFYFCAWFYFDFHAAFLLAVVTSRMAAGAHAASSSITKLITAMAHHQNIHKTCSALIFSFSLNARGLRFQTRCKASCDFYSCNPRRSTLKTSYFQFTDEQLGVLSVKSKAQVWPEVIRGQKFLFCISSHWCLPAVCYQILFLWPAPQGGCCLVHVCVFCEKVFCFIDLIAAW